MKTKPDKIKELETKLIRLGMSDMAYTPYWNKVAKELEKFKDEK